MDAAEEQATRADFFEAVEYVNTQAVKLSDDAQRKLFGLHCVATNGAPPPNDSPSFRTLYENMPESERAKDAAWRAAHDEHPQQLSAMRAYVDEVTREVPDFLLMAPEEDASDDQLAKVKNDLSACGINEADTPPPPPAARDVFEAARAGAASLKAFGDFDVNEIDDYHLTPLIHAVDAERRTPRGFCWTRARTSTGVTMTARRRCTMRLYWGRYPWRRCSRTAARIRC